MTRAASGSVASERPSEGVRPPAGERRRYYDWVAAGMLPAIHGRVLEVGAASGALAARYVDRVSQAVLLEPARDLHEILARRMTGVARVRTARAFLDEVAGREVDGVTFARRSFDVALMVNVLERAADDAGTVALLRTLLGPGGTLVIFAAAAPLRGDAPRRPARSHRYTKRSLTRMITDRGFVVERVRYVDALGLVVRSVGGRSPRAGTRGARVHDSVVVPVSRLVDRLCGRLIGSNVLCIARCADR